jgi:mono/diheme cytochrome c family protein
MKSSKTFIGYFSLTMFLFAFAFYMSGCGKGEEMGVGPITEEIKLPTTTDKALVDKGHQLFDTKCSSCHKFDSRLVGPPLKDVTKRRRPEWIMNQILNPVQMVQENKIAKELFAQYMVQMTFQDVSKDDARALLEYFRAVDANEISTK